MKVGEPVDYLYEPEGKGPIYDHPMDEFLHEIQERQSRPKADIKLSHVFICLIPIVIYLATL